MGVTFVLEELALVGASSWNLDMFVAFAAAGSLDVDRPNDRVHDHESAKVVAALILRSAESSSCQSENPPRKLDDCDARLPGREALLNPIFVNKVVTARL